MTTPDIPAARDALLTARRTATPLAALPPGAEPTDLDGAYAIQDALVDALDRRTVGWKIGASNTAAQQMLGVDGPIYGRVLEGTLFSSGATVPASLFTNPPLAECEIGFELGADLPATAAPFDRAAVLAAVAAVVPTIELVSHRYVGTAAEVGGLRLVADNALAAALVVGPRNDPTVAPTLSTAPVAMVVDGTEVARGDGSAVLGDPVEALVWLANELAARGLGLRAGDVVTTGSCTGLTPLPTGTTGRNDAGALGVVEAVVA